MSGVVAAEEIRESVVEGRFYPAERDGLENMINRFLNRVEKKQFEGELIGLIVPHAGYIFSGQVAAYAYKQLQNREFDTIILLGPSHYTMFYGVSVGKFDYYDTPMGKIQVDKELAKTLIEKDKKIKFLPAAHQREHSLEVQLPFLQTVLKDFKILPIVMGDMDFDTCKMLSENLIKLTENKNVLFIVSTDLSHYHSYEEAIKIDKRTTDAIEEKDAESFYKGIKQNNYELCGSLPVVTILLLAEQMGEMHIELLNYSNSGEVLMGDTSRVVGYSAFAIYKKVNDAKKASINQKNNIQTFEYLNKEEQNVILDIARKSIRTYIAKEKVPAFNYNQYPHLKEKRGVFVTIYKNGNLRGCIGRHESDKPLYELVPEIAVASAFYDKRFPALRKEELDDINIEVSVYLSKLVKIEDIDMYKLGEHGIILKKGFRGATYLPKVPIEQNWDKKETLRHLCFKARLPLDAWKDENTEFYVYATQIIKE